MNVDAGQPKVMVARFNGRCRICKQPIYRGDPMAYERETKSAYHLDCWDMERFKSEKKHEDENAATEVFGDVDLSPF